MAAESIDVPWPRRPIIVAPMAGGPTTPDLVAAVADAGGLGLLAAGYKTPAAMVEEISGLRARSQAPFGVNVFVPAARSFRAGTTPSPAGAVTPPGSEDRAAVSAYRDLLSRDEHAQDLVLPEPDWADSDHYEDKLDVLVAAEVPMVSFTFGCPEPAVVARLHDAGTACVVTVTTREEADSAVQAGADALVVQGYESGGHRGTHEVAAAPNELDHLALLPMMSDLPVPLVAAGGISTSGDTRRALAAGAVAVQVGTAFLLAEEAGTSAAHRMGLTDPALPSCITRAFSGRPARGLRNRFVERYDEQAPAVFPAVDQITKPLRAAAARAGDLQGVSLWAGAGWRAAREAPAADIVAALTP